MWYFYGTVGATFVCPQRRLLLNNGPRRRSAAPKAIGNSLAEPKFLEVIYERHFEARDPIFHPGIRGRKQSVTRALRARALGYARRPERRITDKSGAVVPNAKVTLPGNSDKRTVTVDSAGRYSCYGLNARSLYSHSRNPGFKSTQVKGVEVFINKIAS